MSLLPVGISGEEAGYQIERSLRFDSSASAYLNRTPASAGNRKTWTWSGWVKKCTFSALQSIFSAGTNTNAIYIDDGAGLIGLDGVYNGTRVLRYTTALFRDPSAWYHIVVALDTTQATDSNRIKIYVNSAEVSLPTAAVGTWPAQNSDGNINNNVAHSIGRRQNIPDAYFNGYLTEINFIDGSALDPTSFGEFNTDTGVWQPKAYTGSYGTNGFYLNFSDNSGTTSTTLGKDSSGNGNNWTPNNFSVTAGAGNDSLVDTPTPYGTDTGVGGEVRGNYCTWNPLAKSDNHTVSNGNLDISSSGGTSYGAICATMGASSGKWYWEMLYNRSSASNSPVVGFGNDLFNYRNPPFGYLGSDLNAGGINVISGTAQINGTSTAYGSAIATNDVVMFAMDLDNRKFYIGKNGTWFNSGDPVAGTNSWPYSGTIVGSTFFPAANIFDNSAQTNFGQRPFAYTPPAGFLSLCTTNLPTPTILDGTDYFNTVLYTGTNSEQTLSVGFQPDFSWFKVRNLGTQEHALFDVLRSNNRLMSDTTNAEEARPNDFTGFTSNGVTIKGTATFINNSSYNYVAWNWKANGAGSTNTAGTITSTVSVNTTSGFSIVTYTGTGANATVGHGLGVAPSMVIVKARNVSGKFWPVYHSGLGGAYFLYLNATDATQTATNAWNGTLPSSTVFTVGTSGNTNENTTTYVAYCFAPVSGYSAFSSYTGNGSADGPFVFTGLRARYLLIKRSDAANVWKIVDTARSPSNVIDKQLEANTSNAESSGSWANIDIVSNGFKIRTTDSESNTNGGTYIYAAFAENPFKYSLAR